MPPRLVAFELRPRGAIVREGRGKVPEEECVVCELDRLRLDCVRRVSRQLPPGVEAHEWGGPLPRLLAAQPRPELVLQPLARRLDRGAQLHHALLQVRHRLLHECGSDVALDPLHILRGEHRAAPLGALLCR